MLLRLKLIFVVFYKEKYSDIAYAKKILIS
jgi:hypothetical protein